MNRQQVFELCEKYGLAPNKKLGQNFLIDVSIVEKIIQALAPLPGDRILEIGPGLGAVSQKLAAYDMPLELVEIDSGLAALLKETIQGEHVTVIHQDFLKLTSDRGFTKVVSNLPYYCASEILFTIAQDYEADDVFVMIQKEMAERISAQPGTSSYGALSVTLGLYYEAAMLFNVPASSFYPRPDVQSSFIHLRRHKKYELTATEKDIFRRVVKSSFWGRRKQVHRALKSSPHLSYNAVGLDRALDGAGIDGSRRGETLTIEEFLIISKLLEKEHESDR